MNKNAYKPKDFKDIIFHLNWRYACQSIGQIQEPSVKYSFHDYFKKVQASKFQFESKRSLFK